MEERRAEGSVNVKNAVRRNGNPSAELFGWKDDKSISATHFDGRETEVGSSG